MKVVRNIRLAERNHALGALKAAILDGATHEYQRLVEVATAAGATEADVDVLVHQAVAILFEGAEHPVTRRDLAYRWPTEPLNACV